MKTLRKTKSAAIMHLIIASCRMSFASKNFCKNDEILIKICYLCIIQLV